MTKSNKTRHLRTLVAPERSWRLRPSCGSHAERDCDPSQQFERHRERSKMAAQSTESANDSSRPWRLFNSVWSTGDSPTVTRQGRSTLWRTSEGEPCVA